jgi:hypothetical protein
MCAATWCQTGCVDIPCHLAEHCTYGSYISSVALTDSPIAFKFSTSHEGVVLADLLPSRNIHNDDTK